VVKKRKPKNSEVASRLTIALAIVVAYVLFNHIYSAAISPENQYMGLTYTSSDFRFHLISIVFAIAPLTFLSMSLDRPSNWAIIFLYLFSYVPAAFMVRQFLSEADAAQFLFILLIALLMVDFTRRHRVKIAFSIFKQQKYRTQWMLGLLFSILIAYFLWLAGFSLDLGLANIYERRLASRDLSAAGWSYFVAIGRSVVTIYSLYIFLNRRSWFFLVLLITCNLAIFSLDGTKTSLIIPLFLVFVSYIILKKPSFMYAYLLLPILVLGSVIEFELFDSNLLSQYFVRRIVAGPGFLSIVYWQYFSQNPLALLTDSIGSFFHTPVYSQSVTYVIGSNVLKNPTENADTGMWMGGFAHFGLAGVFVVSALAGFILGLVDNLTRDQHRLIGSLTCAYFGIIWAEQMFHTSLLTGGVLYLMFALLLVTQSQRQADKGAEYFSTPINAAN
jgi:hypothetical protein